MFYGKKFTLGFIGGSITEGSGSSSVDKNYVSLVTHDLAKKYPETRFYSINAGVGGTTSTLGLFRLERDVLSKKPDMVFVEFAVNDANLPTTGIYVENIIRQINRYNPDTAIVLIYTITEDMLQKCPENGVSESVKQHMELAAYHRDSAGKM